MASQVQSKPRHVQPISRMFDVDGMEFVPVKKQPANQEENLCDKHAGGNHVVMLLCRVRHPGGYYYSRKEWFCPAAYEHR